MDHKWRKDRDGAESCEREGCTVRKFGKKWQEKKGRRWNPSHMPLPPCVGKEAAEVKEGLPPLTPEQIEQRAEYARKVLEKRKAPAPSPLEVVRARFHDFIKRKTPSTNEESYWRSALATLEESICKDAMEQAACKVEAQGRQWGILRSMKMTNFADAAQQLADMLRGK